MEIFGGGRKMAASIALGGFRGLALPAGLVAFASVAMAQALSGQPPQPSAEVQAAMTKADAGDPSELLKLADEGRPDAQYYAGGMLIFGKGSVARDPARGCAYEEKASATRGDAMHLVGECYRRGLGGKLDKDKAQAAYTQAVAMGSAESKCVLGEMLFADPAQAERGLALCKEAAQAGDANAQAEVGDFYYRGSGPVKANPGEARKWYEMAAKQKQPTAMRTLGEMYAKGQGGKKDAKKALQLWQDADKAGDPMVSILVADQLFSQLTGGKSPGPGQYKFTGGVPVGDLEVVQEWYEKARDGDPRPDVKKRASDALYTLSYLKQAGVQVTKSK
jgi:TPR repeat protein